MFDGCVGHPGSWGLGSLMAIFLTVHTLIFLGTSFKDIAHAASVCKNKIDLTLTPSHKNSLYNVMKYEHAVTCGPRPPPVLVPKLSTVGMSFGNLYLVACVNAQPVRVSHEKACTIAGGKGEAQARREAPLPV